MSDYYLYKGKVYHCSECTTEAELYGADSFYGNGNCLLFLDELEGGNYVNADDCIQVSPKFPDSLSVYIKRKVYQAINNLQTCFFSHTNKNTDVEF